MTDEERRAWGLSLTVEDEARSSAKRAADSYVLFFILRVPFEVLDFGWLWFRVYVDEAKERGLIGDWEGWSRETAWAA